MPLPRRLALCPSLSLTPTHRHACHPHSFPPSRSPPPPCPRQVSKKLLLLYVQEPDGGADRSSPNALAQVAVHERLVRRWVPESHRLPPPGSK